MTRMSPIIAFLPLLLLAPLSPLAGCDSDSSATDTGADAVTATDTATDTAADTATDTAADAATDTARDAAIDTAADAATDTATDTAADTADDDGADTADDTATDAAAATCDREGFTAEAEDAGPFYEAFLYLAQSTLGAPVDVLTFELTGDAKAAGDYDLTGSHYPDCAACVLVYEGCDENLGNCAHTYLATEGLLSVTGFGESGTQFTGTLTGAKLHEVTLDAQSNSTLVPDGQTWCIDDYAFDATIQ